MRLGRLAWIVAALGLVAATPVYADADVRVAILDGRVSISAKDSTVAEILAEWGRVAGMTIVNAEKLPPERVTIELQNVTEREALDVLLRAMGGYIARRRVGAPLIDYVMVMAPTAPLPPPPMMNARAPAAVSSYGSRVNEAIADVAEPVVPVPAAEQNAPTFTTTIGVVDDTPPVMTPEEETATAPAAQAAIRSRRALETVNPRDLVLPKKGGS